MTKKINLISETPLSAKDLIGLYSRLGGTELMRKPDPAAAVYQHIATVDNIDLLEFELLRPLPLEWRAALMRRRIELAQAAKRAAEYRQAPATGFTVNVPDDLGITDVIDRSGRKYQVRVENGRLVCDLQPHVFRTLLAGPEGREWETANQGSEVWQRMQPGLHV